MTYISQWYISTMRIFDFMDRLKAGKGGREHIRDLKDVMQSVKVLPKGIYGITSEGFGQTHLESAKIFLDAGIRIIQYREKVSPDLEEAIAIKKLCSSYGALFIVNDHVDIAISSKADGLHIGQEDIQLTEAKKKFKGIIGVSATNIEEALKAQKDGADYLGVGTMFATDTKTDAKPVSFGEFERIRGAVSLPIYAIGGIKYEHVHMIKKLGADGIAVISSVLAAPDPKLAAVALIDKWSKS